MGDRVQKHAIVLLNRAMEFHDVLKNNIQNSKEKDLGLVLFPPMGQSIDENLKNFALQYQSHINLNKIISNDYIKLLEEQYSVANKWHEKATEMIRDLTKEVEYGYEKLKHQVKLNKEEALYLIAYELKMFYKDIKFDIKKFQGEIENKIEQQKNGEAQKLHCKYDYPEVYKMFIELFRENSFMKVDGDVRDWLTNAIDFDIKVSICHPIKPAVFVSSQVDFVEFLNGLLETEFFLELKKNDYAGLIAWVNCHFNVPKIDILHSALRAGNTSTIQKFSFEIKDEKFIFKILSPKERNELLHSKSKQ